MSDFVFTVRGEPKPKGSLRAFVVKGRAVMASERSSKDWQALVAFQAQQFDRAPFEGPVEVLLAFHMPRPASASKRIQWPAKKPDIDKLARAALDALTGIVFRDDAQVVRLTAAKEFATEYVGLDVSVREIEAPDGVEVIG